MSFCTTAASGLVTHGFRGSRFFLHMLFDDNWKRNSGWLVFLAEPSATQTNDDGRQAVSSMTDSKRGSQKKWRMIDCVNWSPNIAKDWFFGWSDTSVGRGSAEGQTSSKSLDLNNRNWFRNRTEAELAGYKLLQMNDCTKTIKTAVIKSINSAHDGLIGCECQMSSL